MKKRLGGSLASNFYFFSFRVCFSLFLCVYAKLSALLLDKLIKGVRPSSLKPWRVSKPDWVFTPQVSTDIPHLKTEFAC